MNEFVEILLAAWENRGYRVLIILIVVEMTAIAAMITALSWQTRQRKRYDTRCREIRHLIEEQVGKSEKTPVQWFDQSELKCTDTLRDALLELSGTELEDAAYAIWKECGFANRECENLVEGSTRQRLGAIRRLFVYCDRSVEEAILDAVADEEDHRFRMAAVQVLAGLDSGRGVALALEGVEIERRTMEQPIYAAFRALSTPQMEQLVSGNQSGFTPRVLRILLQVAAEGGLESVVQHLEPMVDHPELEQRLGAARIAASLGGEGGRQILNRLLDDEQWEVRAQAAKGLGRIGSAQTRRKLEEAARDAQFWVRENARWALVQLDEATGRSEPVVNDAAAATAGENRPTEQAGVTNTS